MILVPTDTPGYELVRKIPVMGHEGRGWGTHCETRFTDVRVPVENVLGEPGDGFRIAQKRLGPGRIHHVMRWLGQMQRAFELMCSYSLERKTFGEPLASKQTIQNWIAESAAEIQACRLLTMQAAQRIDDGDEARVEVSRAQVLRREGAERRDRSRAAGARRPRDDGGHAAREHVAAGARGPDLRRPGRGAQDGRRAAHPARVRRRRHLALHVVLEGDRVRLEPLEPGHEDALWEVAQDERAWRLMRVRGNESRELFHEWFESVDLGFLHFFDGELVGHTSYLNVRADDRVVEIGNTWLNPRAWGTGANTEAKLLLLQHAFEDEGFLRVEFKTDAANDRSRAALAAIPAEFEGVFRKHMLVRGGERRDSAWYAVIDDDWPAVKANLERRLAL